MITINKGEANPVVLTLFEKTTLTTPYYLFKFTSLATKDTQYFTATDTSSQKQRYNLFSITEKASNPDNTAGEVTLNPPGQWYYEVYEQSSSTNVDPEDASVGAMVEEGQVWVVGTATSDTIYDSNTTDTVYEG